MGIQDLFRLIENYRVARKVSDARVSTLVFNDGAKISELRAGRDIGARRLERAIEWFSENWPANATWPVDVPRPSPVEQAVQP